MSTTTSTTARILPGAPAGIVRVFTPGRENTPEVRRTARTAAMREHGFGPIGTTPVPHTATLNGVKGFGWDFSPVAVSRDANVSAKAKAAPSVTFAEPDAKAAKKARKAAKKAKAAKADVPFLGAKAKADAATCKTCVDYGVVRKAGSRAGGAYKTQNGADTAKANGNAVPCPSHVTAKAGRRKSA